MLAAFGASAGEIVGCAVSVASTAAINVAWLSGAGVSVGCAAIVAFTADCTVASMSGGDVESVVQATKAKSRMTSATIKIR
jgi:hypothetical protein